MKIREKTTKLRKGMAVLVVNNKQVITGEVKWSASKLGKNICVFYITMVKKIE